MELAPDTYYMSILMVATRACGKALAGKENVRLCSTAAQSGGFYGSAQPEDGKILAPIAPDPISGLIMVSWKCHVHWLFDVCHKTAH